MPTTRLIQEVRGAIAAAFSGIWLNTYEHEDAMAAIADACEKNLWDLLVWDPEYGLITKEDLAQSLKEKKPLQRLSEKNKAINPMEGMIALQNINSESISRAILVMHNFVPYFVNPQGQITQPALLQMLQSLIQKGSAKGDKETCHHVILLAYDHIAMPAELEKMMYVIDHLPPDGDELYELLKSVWPEDSDEVTTMPSRTSPEAIKLVNAASGLSRLEALGAFSKSQAANNGIVKADVLWELKAKMLRKSGLLEMLNKTDMQAADIPVGFKSIGGLNALKEFTLQMFNSPNRDKKIRPQGLTLVGPSGCLDADTVIHYRRGKRNSFRTITLKTLCDKFNGQNDSYASPPWIPGIDTFIHSFNPETGKVFYNKVKAVVCSGVKPCLRLRTRDAGDVILTYDHPVLNAAGDFVPAGEFEVGDKILIKGDMKPHSGEPGPKPRKPRVVVEGLKYYPGGWRRFVTEPTTGKIYEYQRTHRARLVVEAHMNQLTYDELIVILKTEPVRAETLVYLSREYDVHHLNEVPDDDRLGNLQVLLSGEHKALHVDDNMNINREYTLVTEIVSSEYAGEKNTYDITMDLPYSNFVVSDGIIVHNTGKSLFAGSLGDELGIPTIRVDVGRFMGKYVGQTESNTREAFKRLDAMAPCVAMFDEVEKAMGGQNDESGVGGRLMGAILTWLNDHTSEVFPVFTANNIKGLPPELFRAERVDGVFFLDLPNKEQRDAVWDIYIPYYNLTEEQVQERPIDDNWTPAEIKSCCRQARLRNLTLKDAAVCVVPVFKTRREEIIAQQEWANDRCLSAEYRGIFIKGKAAKMLQPGEILAKVDNRPRRRVTRS